MTVNYEGVDISAQVEVAKALLVDNAGGCLDSVEVQFADIAGLWSKWKPSTGCRLQLSQGAFDSGICFVDQIGQQRGLYVLRALSAPLGVKKPKSRSWEQVTLLQLAADVAAAYGLEVKSYGITNHTYTRVDQMGQGDLEFLMGICSREGYAIKVNNQKLLIYDEYMQEKSPPGSPIDLADFCSEPDYQLEQVQYGSCTVGGGGISATFTASVPGDQLRVADVSPSSIGEAQRWAKGLLRQANRKAESIIGTVMLDLSLAAGAMRPVSGIGTADGIYMIDQVEHDLIAQKSTVQLRKGLEGY